MSFTKASCGDRILKNVVLNGGPVSIWEMNNNSLHALAVEFIFSDNLVKVVSDHAPKYQRMKTPATHPLQKHPVEIEC